MKLKSLWSVRTHALVAFLLFSGAGCFGQDGIHGELPASDPLSANTTDPEGSQGHQSGKKSPEKCEYCGRVSDEKVEKFFQDLFKAGVAITLCCALVHVPLWWWLLRRRPFLDINSWANDQVEAPMRKESK